MLYKKLSFWGILLGCLLCVGGQPAIDPFANMSDEELEQMFKFIDTVSKQIEDQYQKMSPEEQAQFDREMREILIQQGVNPDTLEPLNQPSAPEQPHTSPQPTPPPPITTACPKNAALNKDMVSCLVSRLITTIDTLRQRLAIAPFEVPSIRHWLDMLAFLCKTLNTPDHLNRLMQEKYDRLFQFLGKLDKILNVYEKKLAIQPLNDEEDDTYLNPYHILGVLPRSSTEEITEAYQALLNAYDLKKIEQNLIAQNLKPAPMKRKLDAIKLQLRNIEDAYQQLQDPKLRAQIDRNVSVTSQQKRSLEDEARTITYNLQKELHTLVINGLFETFDQFFTEFDPIAVAHRKEMETAEKQRNAEQEARHKLVARPPSYHQNEYQDHGGWFPPAEQSWNPPVNAPSPSSGGQGSPKPFSPEQESLKKERDKGKKPSAPSKEKPKEKTKESSPSAKDKKPAQNPVETLRKEIDKLDPLMQTAAEKLALPKNQDIAQQLTTDTQQLIRTDDPALKLQNEFTQMIADMSSGDKLIKQLETVHKIADEVTKANATAQLTNLWTAHKNRHQNTYDAIAEISALLKAVQQQNPARAFPHPWEHIINSNTEREYLDKLAGIQQQQPSRAQQQQETKQKRARAAQQQAEAQRKLAAEQEQAIPAEEISVERDQKSQRAEAEAERERKQKAFNREEEEGLELPQPRQESREPFPSEIPQSELGRTNESFSLDDSSVG